MQESAPEQLAVKQALFAEIDALAAPETVLASSTSALLCSSFTEHLAGRARCIVAHPANPPYLMPVVEVSGAPWTAPEVVERTRAVMAGIGQTPVLVRKEIYGFVLNRLQIALLHEAFRLLADGVCTPADIDATIKEGLALRWSFMGPLETMDLNAPGGIGDYIDRYEALAQEIGRTQGGTVSWAGQRDGVVAARAEALPRDRVQARQEWRDRRLMALALHKAEAVKRFGD
jgi:3-hydroxyacyl-CoA dehydrogenase